MQTPPKIGTSHRTRFRVEQAHAIELARELLPPVLSTPSLIWFLEHTALELMAPYLETGEITVGVQVEIEHLAPTPIGQEVTCEARVIHAEGPLVRFHIEAHDEKEPIGKGLHARRVVSSARLGERIAKKA